MKNIMAVILALTCLFGGSKTAAELAAVGAAITNTENKEIIQTEQTQQPAAKDEIGVTMTTKNETGLGLTLVFTQSGGSPAGDLQTGSDYSIEKYEEDGWMAVTPLIPSEEIAWTAEAYEIEKDRTTEMELNWSYLYGELETGNYRIKKSIMDFRDTGDYDTAVLYAEFAVAD